MKIIQVLLFYSDFVCVCVRLCALDVYVRICRYVWAFFYVCVFTVDICICVHVHEYVRVLARVCSCKCACARVCVHDTCNRMNLHCEFMWMRAWTCALVFLDGCITVLIMASRCEGLTQSRDFFKILSKIKIKKNTLRHCNILLLRFDYFSSNFLWCWIFCLVSVRFQYLVKFFFSRINCTDWKYSPL